MNPIIVLLVSAKRLSKALRFHKTYLYTQYRTHAHHFSTQVLVSYFYLFLVVVSVIFNEILVLKGFKLL